MVGLMTLGSFLFVSGWTGRPSWMTIVEDALPTPPVPPLSKEDLVALVGSDPKFLVKDSHAGFGYNNIRYMLESTINLASLTGRIPILPDSVWARGCAVQSEFCTEVSLRHFSDRNAPADELGANWIDNGEIWQLPIEDFLDIPHLRVTFGPVLTLREFFVLHDLELSQIPLRGYFSDIKILPSGMDVALVPAAEFQQGRFLRVDEVDLSWSQVSGGGVKGLVEGVMGRLSSWEVASARRGLGKIGIELPEEEKVAVEVLRALGQVPLYTFSDSVLMSKAVALPTTEYAFPSSLLSLHNLSLSHTSADILYIQGDVHLHRKPGAVLFATADARDRFARIVKECIRSPPNVWLLAERLLKGIEEKVGGRRWMAAHLRRGDFVSIGWSEEMDSIAHFTLLQKALAHGREVLASRNPRSRRRLPLPTDPFYLATDESNTTSLAHYRSHGAILLADLLTPTDVAETLGPSGRFIDVLALVEQVILSKSDYFVGSGRSSTTGGVVNLRLARGAGEWSWGVVGEVV